MKKERKIRIGILSFLTVTAISFLLVRIFVKPGDEVRIMVEGKEYGTYSLQKNQRIKVESSLGTNIVEINNGVVTMIEADCENQLCVHMKPLKKEEPGVIVCLPHELVVELKNSKIADQ